MKFTLIVFFIFSFGSLFAIDDMNIQPKNYYFLNIYSSLPSNNLNDSTSLGGFRLTEIDFFENFYSVTTQTSADINGDGKKDIIVSGSSKGTSSSTVTYINQGNNQFELLNNPELSNKVMYRIDFGDIDNDGDLDIFASYQIINDRFSNKLFLNQGNGVFKEDNRNSFKPSNYEKAKLLDIDNDNDLDIFYSGSRVERINEKVTLFEFSAIYINDGLGNFAFKEDNNLPTFKDLTFQFGDLDGDNDLDLVYSGRYYENNLLRTSTLLFFNDGFGNYPISKKIFKSLLDFRLIDLDSDNDLDIINNDYNGLLMLENDSSSSFNNEILIIEPDLVLQKLPNWNFEFFDADNDSDLDIILPFGNTPSLFINYGQNKFVRIPETPFLGSNSPFLGSTSFIDVINESLKSNLVINGKLYVNEGCIPHYVTHEVTAESTFQWIDGVTYYKSNNEAIVILKNADGCDSTVSLNLEITNPIKGGGFIENTPEIIKDLSTRSIAIDDIDNDSDNDIVLSHWTAEKGFELKVLTNQGNREFQSTYDKSSGYEILLSDIDSDTDVDIITNLEAVEVFINNDLFSFDKLISNNGVDRVVKIESGDVNLDGSIDLVISGFNWNSGSKSQRFTKIFLNNGFGLFYEDLRNSIKPVSCYDIELVDLDGDIDLDLVISGQTDSLLSDLSFYKNDGDGVFSLMFDSIPNSDVSGYFGFEDLDNDHDMDMLYVISDTSTSQLNSRIYLNDGKGNFMFKTENEVLAGVLNDSFDFADVDGDLDEDIIVTGSSDGLEIHTILYKNDGNANFTKVEGTIFESVYNSKVKFADLDGDNDPDVVLAGTSSYSNYSMRIYYNENDENNCFRSKNTDLIISNSPVNWIDGNTYNETTNSITHTLTNSMGCDSIITLNLVIKEKVLSKKMEVPNVSIYPNPSSNFLKIELGSTEAPRTFMIIDSKGNQMAKWSSPEAKQSISISQLISGNYLLYIITKDKPHIIKRFNKEN
ncbi:T9SS type A sorting domain-containing protein [uncultured Arcticibacterium sp.]|uniref:T9SS type A sorting domain-containing protein n=1 Tax=uncultured Arcticibacterium sp. TaxID=2173042 RepID=UPI0030FAF98C